MIFIIIIGVLLPAIAIMIFFKNVTTFISLLTAISTLLLGLYQFSKDIRQIDFKIILIPDIRLPDGTVLKTQALFELKNIAYRPVYFQNFPIPQAEKAIMFFSEVEKVNFFKKIMNKVNKKWFKNQLDKIIRNRALILEEDKLNKNQYQKPHTFSIKSGDMIQLPFNYSSYIEFFKLGKRFFVQDTFGKKFYMKKETVDTMKKINQIHNKLKLTQTNK